MLSALLSEEGGGGDRGRTFCMRKKLQVTEPGGEGYGNWKRYPEFKLKDVEGMILNENLII